LSLKSLCEDAIRLDTLPSGGLLGATLNPGRYGDIAEARKALVVHPIYRWLKQELPAVVKLLSTLPAAAEFRFVLLLGRHITIAFDPPSSKARMDKKRTATWAAAKRVESAIHDGTVSLTSPKCNMLCQLLAEARSELVKPRKKSSKHGVLEGLAHALHRDFAISSAKIIMEVATVTGLHCSERSAQRYVKAAVDATT
jgi:hypothetical protein